MAETKSGEIIVIGSANIDFIMKADRLPSVGESVTNAEFSQAFGGKGANQAVAAARSVSGAAVNAPVEGCVSFVASVGNDQYADDMIGSWSESGIQTHHVVKADTHTGCALIMIGEGGNNYITASPAANDRLLPEHISRLAGAIGGASFILMQFEVPESTTEKVLEVAEEKNVPVVWNVAPMRAVRKDLIGRASTIIVNETEAERITGIRVTDTASAESAGAAITKMGAAAAIVTLGAAGSMVADESGSTLVSAFPVEAVDTTAAGDTYCGCLTTALAEGMELPDAVRFASAGAALSVQRLGAQPSVPWRSEIEEFLRDAARS